jgi:rhodanese-related sulfurtransferase
LILVLAALAGAAGILLWVRGRPWLRVPPPPEGIRTLTAAEMARRLAEGWQPVVLDVRTHREYVGPLGHIGGSTLVPVAELPQRIAELGRHRTDPVVAVCLGGVRSAHAAALLLQSGFVEVYNLAGGLQAWIAEELPVDR